MQNHRFDPPAKPEDCPSDSELAALLDGTLEPARAEEVRRHVLDCPSCVEVYADALRFEVEVASEEGGKVLPFEAPRAAELAPTMEGRPRRRFRGAWMGMAAGLVLAALSAYVTWPALTSSRPKPFTREDIAGLPMSRTAALQVLRKEGTVSRDGDSETPESLHATRQIGALLFDLDVAATEGDREMTDQVVLALIQSSKALKTGSSETTRNHLIKVRDDLLLPPDRPKLDQSKARLILETAETLRETEPGNGRNYQDFGYWTETGWLAAGTENRGFFEVAKNRRFLDWLQSNRGKSALPITLSAKGLEQLDVIASAWPREDDPNPRYPELKTAFKKLQEDADEAVLATASP